MHERRNKMPNKSTVSFQQSLLCSKWLLPRIPTWVINPLKSLRVCLSSCQIENETILASQCAQQLPLYFNCMLDIISLPVTFSWNESKWAPLDALMVYSPSYLLSTDGIPIESPRRAIVPLGDCGRC